MSAFRVPGTAFLVLAGVLCGPPGMVAQAHAPSALRAEHVLEGHGGAVTAARWSPDGRRVATACTDGVVRLWDAATGALQRELRGHAGVVWDLDWTTDGTRLVTGGRDGTGRIWDGGGGDELHVLRHGGSGAVLHVRVVNASQVVLHGGDDTPQVWSVDTGEKLFDLEGHIDVVWAMDVAAGRWLVTGSQDRTVRLWDLEDGHCVRAFGEAKDHPREAPNLGPGSPVLCVAIRDDGQVVTAGHRDGTVIRWRADGTTLQEIASPFVATPAGAPPPRSGACVSLATIPGTGRVVAGYAAGTAFVFARKAGAGAQGPTLHGWVQQLAVTPDGVRAACGSWSGEVRLWKPGDPRALVWVAQHARRVTALAVSPDGTRLLSASGDKTARIWKLP